MLNKIVAAGTFTACHHYQFPHRIELVEARENHDLLRDETMAAALILGLLVLLFEEHEVAENIEEAFKLEDILPEVTGAIARLVLRITCTANYLAGMAPPIERQEVRAFALQPCRHMNFVRI